MSTWRTLATEARPLLAFLRENAPSDVVRGAADDLLIRIDARDGARPEPHLLTVRIDPALYAATVRVRTAGRFAKGAGDGLTRLPEESEERFADRHTEARRVAVELHQRAVNRAKLAFADLVLEQVDAWEQDQIKPGAS